MPSKQHNICDDQQLRRLVELADVPTLLIAGDGTIDLINQPARALLGCSADDQGRLASIKIFHPDEWEMVLDRSRRSRRGEIMFPSFSSQLLCTDGRVISAELTAIPCRWKSRGGFLLFIRDQTLEKKLQEQLAAAQRLQSIGTLAAGVAHDFNNLLMGIQARVSFMLSEVEADHLCHEELIAIEQQIRDGAKLTSQLLGCAREPTHEVKPLDLNRIITACSAAFGKTRKEITVELDVAADLCPIAADQVAIEQLLLNLFMNAGDAMPRGGELTLRAGHVTEADMANAVWDPTPGRYVLLSVTDCGIGMDQQTVARIFDPFFTTKAVGKGTGLGLASVYGTVKAHRGYIDVDSTPGAGTTFNIYWPASDAPAAADETPGQRQRGVGGTETILFVDDEERISNAVCRMLERLGYDVMLASSGREAEETYKEHWHRIALVVLDMIMPGMSGEETYDALKIINPDVRVLLSSGYSNGNGIHAILREPGNAFIQKPYAIEELTSEVRQILDAA